MKVEHFDINIGLMCEMGGMPSYYFNGKIVNNNECILFVLIDPEYFDDQEILLKMYSYAVEITFDNTTARRITIAVLQDQILQTECLPKLGFREIINSRKPTGFRKIMDRESELNWRTFACDREQFSSAAE